MAEYIDRGEALGCFHDWVDKNGWVYEACDIPEYQAIENLPAADVIEVVRCKDCENYQTDWQPLSFDDGHYCAMVDTTMPYDGFCHMGERREDGRLNQQTGGD